MANQNTNTINTLTTENKSFYERTLLERLLPNLVFAKYGEKKSYNKNEGDTINFRKFNSLPVVTSKLTEGITPDGQTLDITSKTCKVEQMGAYVVLSDKIQTVGIDPVLTETSEVLGEQASLSIDTTVRDIICVGTNIQYSGGVASRNLVENKIDGTEVRKAVRTLRNNKVKTYDGKYYIALISPDTEFDLMSDTMWQDVSKYSASTQIFDGEIGSLYGVRFVRADNMPKYEGAGASSKDVQATLFLGKGGYAVVDVAGKSKPEMIIKPVGSGEDPLNQRSSAGWKCMFTAVRLEELAILRLEHICS